ncbi:MAG: nitroreductase family deazaflavin-dependent oxidoreductase [Anaerolineae bacterium]|nr:nitroreductase family deazaflavin-dependent oxidoreductase [Anaerolineae bacterium]
MASDRLKPNFFQRLAAQLAGSRPGSWLFARLGHHVDRAFARLTGGRTFGAMLVGLPVVMLTTKGRRSGEPRTTPVVALPDGDRLILVASNWGQQHHPGWYYNLRAEPACVITFRGEARRYRARHVTGEERARYWARATAAYPGFGAYARRTDREIAIFILEREYE